MTGKRSNSRAGFTLVEAVLSVTLLAMMSTVIAGIYMSGLQMVHAKGERVQIDSALRSEMEYWLAQPFADLSDGSSVRTIDGIDYTINRLIVAVDLDGDTVAEPDAAIIELRITELGLTLESLVIDNADRVGKIS